MLNVLAIQGRLTEDPWLSQTVGGTRLCKFGIAVPGRYEKSSEERKTYYFTVIAWTKLADHIVRYFSKGQQILITGELQMHSYTNKEGFKRIAVEILANKVDFCGNKETDDEKVSAAAAEISSRASEATEQVQWVPDAAPDTDEFEVLCGDADPPF